MKVPRHIKNDGHWDYPTVPIGKPNPYHKCKSCGKSVPEINGMLSGHYEWCDWAKQKIKQLENNEVDINKIAYDWLQENATMYRGNNASDCMINAFIAGALYANTKQF